MTKILRALLATCGSLALLFIGFTSTAWAAPHHRPPVITHPVREHIAIPYNGSYTFKWTKVPGAVSYDFDLEYFDARYNSWTTFFNPTIEDNFLNVDMRSREGHWRVRVRARLKGNGGLTPFSDYTDFSLRVAPPAPRLSVTNNSVLPLPDYEVGTTQATLGSYTVNASNSSEDIELRYIVMTDDMTGTGAQYEDIENLRMYDGAQALLTAQSTWINRHEVVYSFSPALIIPKGTSKTLTLKGDIAKLSSNDPETHTFSINDKSSSVLAMGTQTQHMMEYTLLRVYGTSGPIGIHKPIILAPPGTLALSLVRGQNASPANDRIVNVGAANVPVFAFKLKPENENAKLRNLKITATGSSLNGGTVVNLKLYQDVDAQPFATANAMQCANNTCVVSWSNPGNLLPREIPLGSATTIYVWADIGGAGIAGLGDSFKFKVEAADIGAIGSITGANVQVNGTAAVEANTFINPCTVVITPDAPQPGASVQQAVLQGTQLGRFKVSNQCANTVTLTALPIIDHGEHTGTSTYYGLRYSDENNSNYIINTAVASSTLDFSNIAVPISGFSYRYFTALITSKGAIQSGDTWQLGIDTLGTVQYQAREVDLGYDGNLNGSANDVITNLWVDGKPQLGTLVKQ